MQVTKASGGVIENVIWKGRSFCSKESANLCCWKRRDLNLDIEVFRPRCTLKRTDVSITWKFRDCAIYETKEKEWDWLQE